MHRLIIIPIFTLAAGTGTSSAAWAQWSIDPAVNTPVCTETGTQRVPVATSDGAGGVIIEWTDTWSALGPDIFAQRLDASGTARWTPNGIPISSIADAQFNPRIVSDGAGGAIAVWEDQRSGVDSDIYAQRVAPDGAVLWTEDGVPVCADSANQFSPRAESDGSGGILTVWVDDRKSSDDIFAQRLDNEGTRVWTPAEGVAVCTAERFQTAPALTGDGSGGAAIAWHDFRNGMNNDIFAQRVDAAGAVVWGRGRDPGRDVPPEPGIPRHCD